MTKILFRRHWIKSRSKIKHLHLHLVCRAIKRFVLDVDAVVEVDDVVAALRLDHHPALVLHQLNHVPIRDPNSDEKKLDPWLKW